MKSTRRTLVKIALAAAAFVGVSGIASDAFAQEKKPVKVLFLTKSSGFQHSVVTRKADDPTKLAHAEQALVDLGKKNGFDVTVTKDADIFDNPETYKTYDVFAFYTTADLTKASDKYSMKKGPDGKNVQDKLIHTEKPMSPKGKEMFLKSLEEGKGFVGFHCASDTFHSRKKELLRDANALPADCDPYIVMVGGEFSGHGSQQKAMMRVVTKNFPGLEGLQDFELFEEWYGLHNLAPDMQAILVQDTTTMKVDPKTNLREKDYQRPPFPATWARMQGKGRVFYTSMGHREDVWTNEIFLKMTVAGMNWAAGKTEFKPQPNIPQVAPQPKPEHH